MDPFPFFVARRLLPELSDHVRSFLSDEGPEIFYLPEGKRVVATTLRRGKSKGTELSESYISDGSELVRHGVFDFRTYDGWYTSLVDRRLYWHGVLVWRTTAKNEWSVPDAYLIEDGRWTRSKRTDGDLNNVTEFENQVWTVSVTTEPGKKTTEFRGGRVIRETVDAVVETWEPHGTIENPPCGRPAKITRRNGVVEMLEWVPTQSMRRAGIHDVEFPVEQVYQWTTKWGEVVRELRCSPDGDLDINFVDGSAVVRTKTERTARYRAPRKDRKRVRTTTVIRKSLNRLADRILSGEDVTVSEIEQVVPVGCLRACLNLVRGCRRRALKALLV